MSTSESDCFIGAWAVTRARIPLSAFRVPKGKVALTLLLHGRSGLTGVFDATDIDRWLTAFEVGMNISNDDRPDPGIHVQLRELLRRGLSGGSTEVETCTVAGLWLVLNHPFGAKTLRRSVSAALREADRVHITLTSDARQMWSVAVSEKPVEPEVFMAALPIGTNACLDFGGVSIRPLLQ
jgi:hypothetical protein